MSGNISRHHLAFDRIPWSSFPDVAKIRGTRSLIPHIYRDVHDDLHDHCPPIPVMGRFVMSRVNYLFTPVDETFADIDNLCRAFDKATKQSTPLERDMAGLCIEAIREQISFIRRGIV